jgi:hypothetical protein
MNTNLNPWQREGRRNDSRSRRRGIMLILFALLLAPLLALIGLTIDGGRVYFEKRRMQAAADGGAFGAAREILRGNDGFVVSAGRDDTKLNGFDNALSDITVTVNRPPSSGPNSGNNNAVEVIIERPIPTMFMKIIRPEDTLVRARAVADVEPEWDPPYILTLDPDARGAITISGTTDINVPECTIVAKSNNPQALTINGGVNVVSGGLGFGASGGGYVQNGQGSVEPWPPWPVQNANDPYSKLEPPNESQFDTIRNSRLKINSTPASPLEPGIYNGGIQITGGDVVLNPGIYIVDGFSVNGDSITGDGVMIYNRGTRAIDNIFVAGNVAAELHAIRAGQTMPRVDLTPYVNILFYNSRTATVNNGSTSDGTLLGTLESTYDGVMYFPTVKLNYCGSADQDGSFAMIISDTLELSGNPFLGADWEGANRTPTIQQISLLE